MLSPIMTAPDSPSRIGDAPRNGTLLAIGPIPPPINGLSKAFQFVTVGLKQYGWDLQVVDSADRSSSRVGSGFSVPRMTAVMKILLEAVRAVPRADVVYLTIAQSRLGFAKDMVALRWAALLGRPVVVHMHGGNFGGFYASLSGPERQLVKGTLDRVAAIVVLTESLKGDFRMTQRWEERTVAISNTCDTRSGAPRRRRPGELRILYLSNLLVAKGYRETLMAAGQLASRRPNLTMRVDLAGGFLPDRDFPDTGAQAEDLHHLISELPANVAATYHGEVDGSRKQTLLDQSDVLVLPTSYINEGQPIAIIEALTSGLPVVATDWRGVRETLPEKMHQLLVPRRDATAVAEKLAALVDSEGLLAEQSAAALAHAATFSVEKHLRALDAVLRRAAGF